MNVLALIKRMDKGCLKTCCLQTCTKLFQHLEVASWTITCQWHYVNPNIMKFLDADVYEVCTLYAIKTINKEIATSNFPRTVDTDSHQHKNIFCNCSRIILVNSISQIDISPELFTIPRDMLTDKHFIKH